MTLMVVGIATGTIVLISIVLTIVNMVQLTATSSKIAFLDTEIEKKTREFDAIKKDKATDLHDKTSVFMNPADDMQIHEAPMTHTTHASAPEIEIIRNVRESYSGTGHDTTAPMHEHNAPPSGAEDVLPEAAVPNATPVHSNEPIQSQSDNQDVMDVVSEQDEGPGLGSDKSNLIDIALYSPELGSPDFAGAWRVLANRLPQTANPRVRISLGNINALEPHELQYLQKFSETITNHGGVLSLLHCNQGLHTFLKGTPALMGLIS